MIHGDTKQRFWESFYALRYESEVNYHYVDRSEQLSLFVKKDTTIYKRIVVSYGS